MQESPIPLAAVPKAGIHKLGTGSGARVDVAWLSRSSAALEQGCIALERGVSSRN